MITSAMTFRARTKPTQRIQRLRQECLAAPHPIPWEVALYGGESWRETWREIWWIVRRGKRVAHVLRNMEVLIGPDDLIVGRITSRAPKAEEQERIERANDFMAAQPLAGGQAGHMAPDIETLLSLGCRGVQAKIAALASALNPADPEAAAKLAFYRAAQEALDGLCDFAQRYAEEAERLAEECPHVERAAELREIAKVCRHVPAHPARTFYEALQAVHFLLFAINVAEGSYLTSPGSVDRWLFSYLKKDLANGRITYERAQELLDCFFLTFNTYIAPGLAIGLLVGGRDAHGEDITNDLTWMALHAIDHVRLAYPSTGLRIHQNTDPKLLDLAFEILAEGVTQPALFNDEVITNSLIRMGLPPEDACDYMNSTCVEITPSAKSNVWVASPYYNLPQILLDIIGEVAGGQLTPPATLDDLLLEYDQRLGEQIASGVAHQNALRYSCMVHRNFPLASCFVKDCLERGLDLDQGGARYNWIECSFVGLATLVDSLQVVRRFVMESRELSWQKLHAMLQHNFEGDETWRQRFLHEVPKYGNGVPEVDDLARRVIDMATTQCRTHHVLLGGTYEPGLFAWVQHGHLGEQTGATPDGRVAGTALSPGPDPAPGRATAGPTAAVHSVTAFEHTPLIGGVAFNLKFSPADLATPEQRGKLAALIRTYFSRGGFQAQISVVDRQTLYEAREHPELYRDLLVRVAGYSDYFVHLTPTLQDEIIARAESRL
ncbi:MAG: pyruvate formate lyase family protein [Candidatus Zipacnadales bacterium]